MTWYTLAEDGETPVPHVSLLGALRIQEAASPDGDYGRIGNWHGVRADGQTAQVSTIFLTIDHSWPGSDRPVLWETMVFCSEGEGKLDQYQARYSSAWAAKRGQHWLVWLMRRLGYTDVEVTR